MQAFHISRWHNHTHPRPPWYQKRDHIFAVVTNDAIPSHLQENILCWLEDILAHAESAESLFQKMSSNWNFSKSTILSYIQTNVSSPAPMEYGVAEVSHPKVRVRIRSTAKR